MESGVMCWKFANTNEKTEIFRTRIKHSPRNVRENVQRNRKETKQEIERRNEAFEVATKHDEK